MAYTQNMTEGKPFPIIFRYFVPILFSCLLQQLYSIVDTIVVGKGINDMALAAVGATGSISFFIFGFIMGLGTGMAVLVAQAYGGGNYERLRKAITMGIVSTGTVSLVIMLAGIVFMRPLLLLLNTSEVILEDAILYIVIILAGIPLTLLYNCFSGILNSLGDSKTPLYAVVISTLVNIALDIFLIVGCHMGVEGAAIGTLIAQCCAGGFCYFKLRKITFLHLKKEDWILDMKLIREEIRVGIPVAFMNSVTAIGTLLVQYFVNRLGVNYTAAFSACTRLTGFIMQPCAAAGMAMSTYAGQNFGAGKMERILQGIRSSFWLAISIALIGTVLLAGFPRQLAGLMLSDVENINLCVTYLRICGGMMWAISFLFLTRDTCQGMGFTFVPMLSGFMELAARVIATIALTSRIGYNAIAIAEVSAWVSAFLLNGSYLWLKLHKLIKSGKETM
ncbi:MAG: MATE family efflux transporter [Lachnospiraceae bacterium]|nr:MATE family efflux transporter [Lachnospiraceae bacterium]